MARVLIVDDMKFFRHLVRGLIEAAGHTVVGEASEGLQAVKLYRELMPDVVLMDLLMPGVDGFAAMRMIRRINGQARFVVCTAMTDEESIIEAMSCGAADILAKPFRHNRLLQAVSRTLAAASPAPPSVPTPAEVT